MVIYLLAGLQSKPKVLCLPDKPTSRELHLFKFSYYFEIALHRSLRFLPQSPKSPE